MPLTALGSITDKENNEVLVDPNLIINQQASVNFAFA